MRRLRIQAPLGDVDPADAGSTRVASQARQASARLKDAVLGDSDVGGGNEISLASLFTSRQAL